MQRPAIARAKIAIPRIELHIARRRSACIDRIGGLRHRRVKARRSIVQLQRHARRRERGRHGGDRGAVGGKAGAVSDSHHRWVGRIRGETRSGKPHARRKARGARGIDRRHGAERATRERDSSRREREPIATACSLTQRDRRAAVHLRDRRVRRDARAGDQHAWNEARGAITVHAHAAIGGAIGQHDGHRAIAGTATLPHIGCIASRRHRPWIHRARQTIAGGIGKDFAEGWPRRLRPKIIAQIHPADRRTETRRHLRRDRHRVSARGRDGIHRDV